MKRIWIVFSILILNLITPSVINAHPGRTAADGCHYCRTNCDRWGVPWGERHCHGGGTVQGTQEQQPIYTPPTSTPIPLPTWTPVPTNTPIPTKTPTPTLTYTSTPTPNKKSAIAPEKKISNMNKSKTKTVKKKTFWQWLVGLR